MRIGVNMLYLIPGVVGGTERYARELLDALARNDAPHEYFVFLNRTAADLSLPDDRRFVPIIAPISGRSRAVRYAWEQVALPTQLARRRIDLVHSLGYVGPLVTPCPHVATIHDVNFETISMTPTRRAVLRFFVGRTARTASHVLTVSEFSRGEIVRHLHVRPEDVTVAHEGARAGPRSIADRGAVLGKHRIRDPYALVFSSSFPHKNIARLVEAFLLVRHRVPQQLCIVGHLTTDPDQRRRILDAEASGAVRVLGFVEDGDVLPLMQHADYLAFPSLYEGFGLPVLDAQSIGLPVACSNQAALPEVAGDGVAYFDPLDVNDIARALESLGTQPAWRTALAKSGRQNAERFSWDRMAAITLGVYERVARSTALTSTLGH